MMIDNHFLTFAQYFDSVIREVAADYGYTLAEARRILTPESYWNEYITEAVNAIEAGYIPSYRVWHTWPADFRDSLFRCWQIRTNDDTAQVFVEYQMKAAC